MSESMGLAGEPGAVTGGEGNPAQLQNPNETEVTESASESGVVEAVALPELEVRPRLDETPPDLPAEP